MVNIANVKSNLEKVAKNDQNMPLSGSLNKDKKTEIIQLYVSLLLKSENVQT